MRHLFKTLAIFAPTALLAAACGGGSEGGGSAESSDASEQVSVEFAATGGSAAEGVFRLSPEGENYNAVVSIDTHRGPGDYPVHIHEGTCATGGSVVVPLTSVEGGEGGEGQSRTTFSAADLAAGGTYFVQLHDAQDQSPIACADLPPL